MKILVTGGCGFIGSNFIHYFLKKYPDDSLINVDKLTYAGNLKNLSALSRSPRYAFIRGDIADPLQMEEIISQGVDAHRQLCRGVPCGPFDRGPDGLHENECLWDLCSSGGDPEGLFEKAYPFPPCLDRRGLRVSGRDRGLYGRNAHGSQQSLFGKQGLRRPDGAGLSSHLRASHPDHPMLQQLWTLSVSGKTDSPPDFQCHRRERRFPSTATGSRFETGSMWKITAGASTWSSTGARKERSTTSEARAKSRIFP